MERVPDNADIPALSKPVFLRTQDSRAPAPIDRVQDETGDPTPTKNPATLDASMDTKSIVEPVRAGDDGPRNLVSLLDCTFSSPGVPCSRSIQPFRTWCIWPAPTISSPPGSKTAG